jgi:hypothetical protein
VVILGIGFIMVAAIFPVAIQQTQSTGEENIAAIAARDAADAIIQIPTTVANPNYSSSYTLVRNANGTYPVDAYKSVATYPVFPPTVKNYYGTTPPPAVVIPFTGSRWKLLQSDSIMISDQRYAYVPFYKRENGSSAAELIVIAVAVRNKPVYQTPIDALNSYATATVNTSVNPNFDSAAGTPNSPIPAQSTTVMYPDTITISGPAASEGCSVTGPVTTGTPFAGRTYTCGFGANGTFEINPGDGLALTAGMDGVWGHPYPIRDPVSAGQTFAYTSSTTLQPQVAYATLAATAANPAGQINLFDSPAKGPAATVTPSNIGPGAFVIVADDYPFAPGTPSAANYQMPSPAPYPPIGSMNGRIFRLGTAAGPGPSGLGTIYNLDPAYGMLPGGAGSPDTVLSPGGPGNFGVKVYIVGVGQVNGAYTGPTQDTGVFATYFPVK